MGYEYKCVAAPERAKRARGAKTRTERVASAMQDLINAEATDGWEYLRTDLVPVIEKAGFLSRPQEVHRAVLVFCRMVGGHMHQAAPIEDVVPLAPAEPVRRAPAAPSSLGDSAEEEEPIRLAVDRPRRGAVPGRQTPSGLG